MNVMATGNLTAGALRDVRGALDGVGASQDAISGVHANNGFRIFANSFKGNLVSWLPVIGLGVSAVTGVASIYAQNKQKKLDKSN